MENNIFGLRKGRYYIAADQFEKFLNSLNEEQRVVLSSYVYRAESVSNWFIDGHTENHFFPTPIMIYNQDFDLVNDGILAGDDIYMHKHGVILHEQ